MAIVNCAFSLADLPAPPEGKTGWPWTEQSELSGDQPGDSEWPKISVVTPSYNQGQFIEETLRSVLLQNYPNLEYIVVDGASEDSSLKIIRKYQKHISFWMSEPDRGQSEAINKGFSMATGNIVCFLNSDDLMTPNTLFKVALFFLNNLEADFICGQTKFINKNSAHVVGFEELFRVELNDSTMTETCHIAQPSTYFRSKVFSDIGYFNESLKFCFDYDFWLRAFLSSSSFHSTNEIFSYFRLHDSSKTIMSYKEGYFDRDFISIYESALLRERLTSAQKRGLLRGLSLAASLLFVHLENTKTTEYARSELFSVIQRNPRTLLFKSIWPTFLVSFTPTILRKTWQTFRSK